MEITRNITKNSIKIGKLIVLVFIFFGFHYCSTSHTPAKRHKNLSYLYNDSEILLHPRYQVYNLSKDSSEVFVKISISDLLIKDLGKDYDKYALLEIHYRLYESLSIGGLLDSSTFFHKIVVEENKPINVFSFKIKTPNYQKTYLSIKIKDVFSERTRKDYLEIDKAYSVSRQSFLIKESQTKELVFGSELLLNKTYTIQSPLLKKHRLYIQEQKNIQTIATPPASSERIPMVKLIPDTTYAFDGNTISFDKPRFVFLSFDTTRVKGIALFLHDSLYNYLHTPTQMIEPLRYLVDQKEYQEMLLDSNPKLALDRFWLRTASDVRHAEEMIKVYYHRVAVANKYFSSYQQGWRTDRGMVYVIYGEPSKIYKSQILERWIYGTMDSERALTFDFDKRWSPFSDNNYRLVRGENYKQSWSQAVSAWKDGRIYSIAK